MVLFEGVVEAESFATAEDEPMADEEATAEKPEEPEIPRDAQTTEPIPNSAETLAPPPTDGVTEAAVTTPPVVTPDELNAAATESRSPTLRFHREIQLRSFSISRRGPRRTHPASRFDLSRRSRRLNRLLLQRRDPGIGFRSNRYAVSDEEESDDELAHYMEEESSRSPDFHRHPRR
ncbi:unnamed protein product [Microthlaspi erraticum]|uniref:Uncharacterized protein n=1 Tax=Microthlaspi erraticum TaxID=1685480 RepID=A0A6D2L178_9BRAS|nr:unnamed protein product [Microthlaspi erraticum]